jgi:drug/metabolite transporter (DMT)-like permease
VTGRQWAGLLLGLIGVALVSFSDATAPGGEAPAWAYLIPFAGMLSLVASTILERRARVLTPPIEALGIHCATSAIVFTALAVASGSVVPPASVQFWIAMTWLMVLPTFGGYGLYWFLVERIGVTPVNSLMFLMPPVTAVWGAAMFGEPLTPVTVLGLTLALAAALVASRSPGRAARARPTSQRRQHSVRSSGGQQPGSSGVAS